MKLSECGFEAEELEKIRDICKLFNAQKVTVTEKPAWHKLKNLWHKPEQEIFDELRKIMEAKKQSRLNQMA